MNDDEKKFPKPGGCFWAAVAVTMFFLIAGLLMGIFLKGDPATMPRVRGGSTNQPAQTNK